MPSQEAGTKVARALPYKFEVTDDVVRSASPSLSQDAVSGITLNISNTGSVGAAFTVHNYGVGSSGKPKRYVTSAVVGRDSRR
jgi:archaellum component FlaG (FlaF/FlaG flagellin family)